MADASRILVVDDDHHIRTLLSAALAEAGFAVESASNGGEALEKVSGAPPDLILLDVDMPVLNGWETVKRLRADPLRRHLPVIMLTSHAGLGDKVQGLELGANDYVTKPFELVELLARVRSSLRHTRAELEANPLSGLPGNNAIEHELLERIQEGARFSVLYADLNNFKAFNDRYGFVRGDRLLLETSKILVGNRAPRDFVGHVGGDDFILVTTPDRCEALCQRIIEDFDREVPSHYDIEDREKGYIEVADRQGKTARFAVAGIAIGVVSNAHRPLTSLGQISRLGAEMKTFAKKSGKSAYAVDRRTS